MDGGIRSGQDVLKAVAMGAQGVYLGRAFLYGLGAMGEKGVTKSLEIIHKELDTTLALCGLRDIHDVDTRILRPGTYPLASSQSGAEAARESRRRVPHDPLGTTS